MGVVYEAEDRERGGRVAVKTLRSVDPEGLLRFKREFRTLARLSHPHLVQLYELVNEGDEWFFTMELLDGVSFLHWVRGTVPRSSSAPPPVSDRSKATTLTAEDETWVGEPESGSRTPAVASRRFHQPPADLDRLRQGLIELVEGLGALHHAGHVHRDVKPSNVLVTKDNRVVVLDFGIIAVAGSLRDGGRAGVVGTPAYMAPEQSAGGAVLPAADFYSVGVILFEALTGVRPFEGSGDFVLHSKRLEAAPPVLQLAPNSPPALAELCDRLLSRSPAERPERPEILSMLGAGSTPSAASDIGDLVVGRSEPLLALRRSFDAVRDGVARTVFVSGESGIGKSCLVEEFLREVEGRALVLRGRCFERESVPYKALDDLVDALAATLRARGKSAIRDLLPDDFSAAAILFPVLDRLVRDSVAPAQGDIGDREELQRRAFASLHALLSRLADEAPVVIFVDDLQWGDLASVPFLSDLIVSAPRAVLFLATYRSEDRRSSPVLLRLLDSHRESDDAFEDLTLGPLSESQLNRLATRSVGVSPDESTLRRCVEESRGRPYFLQELLRWTVASGSTDRAVDLDDVIRARAERLEASAMSVLRVLALAGRPISWALAERVADVRSSRAQAASELRAGRFIRATGDGPDDRVQTYHDRVREAVAGSVDPEHASEIHRRFADELEGEEGDATDRFAIARHRFLGRNDSTRGLAFDALVAAAREAVATHAYDQAFAFFDQAFTVASESGRAVEPWFDRQFGEVAALVGRMERATQHLQRALNKTLEPTERAGVHLILARVRLGKLDSESSVKHAGLGLGELGQSLPTASILSVLASLFALVRGAIALQLGVVEQRSERRGHLRRIADLFTHVGLAAYFQMERVILVESLLRSMPFSARLGPTRQLAEWYALAATVLSILRKARLAMRMRQRAVEVAAVVGSPASEARARQYGAHTLHFLGLTERAEDEMVACLDEGGRLLQNQDYFTAAADLAWSTILRGRPEIGWRWIDAALRRASLEGEENPLTQGHTFRCYAGPLLAFRGFPEEGRRHLQSFGRFIERTADDRWRWGQWLAHSTLFALEAESTDEELEKLIERFRSLRLSPRALPLQLTHFYVAQLRFRIGQWERRPEEDSRFSRLVRRARGELTAAGRGHPTLRAHLFACDARVALVAGDNRRADRAVAAARRLADETGNDWVLWELALLQAQRSPSESASHLAEAESRSKRLGWRSGRDRTPGIGLPR